MNQKTSAEFFNKRIGSKTIRNRFCLLIIAILLLLYVFFTMTKVAINSDFANHLLEANDMIHGNFFLSDWQLTGISFLTTEMPYYCLAVAILGVQPYAYVLALTLIVFVFFLVGLFLINDRPGEISFVDIGLYLALAVACGVEKAGHFRGHTAVFSLALIAFWAAVRYLDSPADRPNTGALLALTGVIAWAAVGDVLIVIIAVLPVALFCGYHLLLTDSPLKPKRCLTLIVMMGIGVLIGLALDWGYFTVGGAVKNAILSKKSLIGVDAFPKHFLLFVKGLVELANGYTRQSDLTVVNLIRFAFVILSFVIGAYSVIETLTAYVCGKHRDTLAVLLSLSLVLMTVVCLATDVLVTPEFTRYFSFFPVFGAIVVIRALNRYGCQAWRFCPLRLSMNFVVALIVLIVFGASFVQTSPWRVVTKYDRVAQFLEDNNLEYGLAHYWNASAVTVSSRGAVKIRSIKVHREPDFTPTEANIQHWFYKPAWFSEGTFNFVLLDDNGYLDVSKDAILELFGEPEKRLSFEDYEVFVYDRNLAPELK